MLCTIPGAYNVGFVCEFQNSVLEFGTHLPSLITYLFGSGFMFEYKEFVGVCVGGCVEACKFLSSFSQHCVLPSLQLMPV